ncbi:sulfatase family protein [Desertivirga arenae]|uniref:sulfatase family protein n=1 Tax=Desertivirga arenae TaxID=2810309 RepID=UPI001A95E809|nr:sulfatase [Pedobacter sp. SYSU D00823]
MQKNNKGSFYTLGNINHWLVRQGAHLLLALSGFTAIAQTKAAKPNIIFILTDDHRWDALGVAGNSIIQTPNLDRLANAGTRFGNAYVTTAICCTSRASILSGQYVSRHKINNFTTDFSQEAVRNTYPFLLKKAGYKTGFIGKYGVGLKPPIEEFDYWSCTPKVQPDYELKNLSGEIVHNTDSVSSDIQKFLDQFGKQGPFCLSIGFKAPHELDGNPPKFIVQDRFKNLYNDNKVPVPQTADPRYWESFPDFFKTEENIARVRWRTFFSSPELYQESVKNYYRLITGVDEAVGKLVSKLKELGIADNTIVIFMGDNGFYLGEHGLEGKWYGHEESIRVPLIIYNPLENLSKGKVSEQVALNIDIAPTILGAAGLSVSEGMQGNDLLKEDRSKREFFYEHTFQGSPKIPKVEGVAGGRWKYMLFTEHNYEELYDVKNDPHETKNLAGDKRFKGQLETMRRKYKDLKLKAL